MAELEIRTEYAPDLRVDRGHDILAERIDRHESSHTDRDSDHVKCEPFLACAEFSSSETCGEGWTQDCPAFVSATISPPSSRIILGARLASFWSCVTSTRVVLISRFS